MTEVLVHSNSFFPGSLRASDYYAMSPDQHETPDWRQQYYPRSANQMSMLSSQWTPGTNPVSNQGPAMGGMAEVDLRMFQHESIPHYATSVTYPNHPPLISPSISYGGEGPWAADVDMGTPSTAGFSNEIADTTHAPLRVPTHPSSLNHSPHSSLDDFSPHPQHMGISDSARPGLGRSVTAPDYQQQIAGTHHRTATGLAGLGDMSSFTHRKSEASEDGDDDRGPGLGRDESQKDSASTGNHHTSASSAPGATTSASNRGRKRQRIPHTAVERRYRENLNSHLDKLRQAVPLFNQSVVSHAHASGEEVVIGEGVTTSTNANGVRPSKCEILTGAIDHIVSLGRENDVLKAENKALRQRLEDVERWFQQQQQVMALGGNTAVMNR